MQVDNCKDNEEEKSYDETHNETDDNSDARGGEELVLTNRVTVFF